MLVKMANEITKLTENLLLKIILIGFLLIGGSLAVLAIGTALNPSWFSHGLLMIFPFLVIGFIIIVIASKINEVLK